MFRQIHLGELVKNPWLHLAFYVFGFVTLRLSHKISPTNLAGPGLDMFVLFAFIVSIIGIFIWALFRKGMALFNRLFIILVHIAGIVTLVWWVNQPS